MTSVANSTTTEFSIPAAVDKIVRKIRSDAHKMWYAEFKPLFFKHKLARFGDVSMEEAFIEFVGIRERELQEKLDNPGPLLPSQRGVKKKPEPEQGVLL